MLEKVKNQKCCFCKFGGSKYLILVNFNLQKMQKLKKKFRASKCVLKNGSFSRKNLSGWKF